MLFDSLQFAIFFALVLPAAWLTRKRVAMRNALLLAASYYFYACWDWRFLGLIAFSTGLDYLCGRLLGAPPAAAAGAAPAGRRRAIILASLIGNLGVLGFFKYYGFFADSLAALLGGLGLEPHLPLLRVALPVGISFYTFKTLSYTIDVYRGKLPAERSLLNYALYLAFFPQLVAGPIERAQRLLPQIAAPTTITREALASGAWLIGLGLFKKVVLADNVETVVGAAFGSPASSGFFSLLGIYAFAIQIYCDFSGYSDLARGTARCLGFETMLNFNLPYASTNPTEFWQRWHISLSAWLRDYLFLPFAYLASRRIPGERLLGVKAELWIYTAATLATMTLAGLWHGASWLFVLWGLYHGVLLSAHRALKPLLARLLPGRGRRGAGLTHLLSILFFFHLTCFGWLIFRARNLAQVGEILVAIPSRFIGTLPGSATFEHLVIFGSAALALFLLDLVAYRSRDLNFVYRWPTAARGLVYAAGLLAIILFGRLHGQAFIYFQF